MARSRSDKKESNDDDTAVVKERRYRRWTTALTRLVTLTYVVLSFLAYLEVRKLRLGSKSYDFANVDDTIVQDIQQRSSSLSSSFGESTVMQVPLMSCSSAIVVDGNAGDNSTATATESNTISGSGVQTTIDCQSLDYVVTACAVGLILSSLVTLFVIIVDVTSRRRQLLFDTSSVSGMKLFLIIILIQTAIVAWSLVEQISISIDGLTQQLALIAANMESSTNIQIESYANTKILKSATVFGFTTAIVLFIDALIYHCRRRRGGGSRAGCTSQKEVETDDEEVEEKVAATVPPQTPQTPTQPVTVSLAVHSSHNSTTIVNGDDTEEAEV